MRHYCTGGAAIASPGNAATQDETGAYIGNGRCPIGHYCPAGSVQPEPCPKGTYSTEEELVADMGENGCTACGAGKYCDQLGATSAAVEKDCQRGYICLSRSDIPNPTDGVKGYICPAGSYCLAGAASSTLCPVNSYQPAEGKWDCLPCEEGRQCDKPGMSEAKECPAGYYCLSGKTKTPCPVGTYSDKVNLASSAACLPCKQGFYCGETGQTESKDPCSPGHYCGSGAKVADPMYDCEISNSSCNGKCPPGHYCEDGLKYPCPAGTYYDKTGAASAADCLNCTAGFYCNSGTVTPTLQCARGYYCPGGSSSPEHLKCPRGARCGVGTGVPEPCPASTYQSQEGMAECYYCTESHYCPLGAVEMLDCLPYSYCPHETGDPPPLCKKGTYTKEDVRGLRKPEDCEVCPIGKYCTDGQITGACSAGYLCVSGSYYAYSNNSFNETNHRAWPCPPGHYCLEGAESAVPCPVDTYRSEAGGAALADCLSCPIGWQCPEGSSTGIPCPAGSYCPSDSDTQPCPEGYYNNKTGQTNMMDACIPCPAGYFCNETALPTIEGHECPVGHYCTGMNNIARCPVGFMRNIVGGSNSQSCFPCTRGRYCDGESDAGHISGHGCPAGHYCQYSESEGTPAPKACPAGTYCPGSDNLPLPCPAGYFCGAECEIPEICKYPRYCPEGSINPLKCPLGWKAAVESGALRTDLETFCTPCNAGLYGNLNGTLCLSCPQGYYCVEGTNGPDVWNGTYTCPEGSKCPVPCPQGTYCPIESPEPSPCPAGTYNDVAMGVASNVCKNCSANTYNFFTGQAKCKPCGSSAESKEGAKVCTCVGANRYFLMSDGSCRCKSGFVFYDETDKKESDGNSVFDCQRAVDERCQAGQMRLSTTRQCVTIEEYNCTAECGATGGELVPHFGRCICNKLVDPTEVCDEDCLSKKPTFSLQVDQKTGKLQLVSTLKTGETSTVTLPKVTGFKEYDTTTRKTQMVSFTDSGFQGKIYGDSDSAVQDLTRSSDKRRRRSTTVTYSYQGTVFDGVNDRANFLVGNQSELRVRRDVVGDPASFLVGNQSEFRVRRDVVGDPASFLVGNQSELRVRRDVAEPGVTDPTICLNEGEVVAWTLTEDSNGRSHYPAYIKDHLLNDNEEFDYGPFDRLGEILTTTNATYYTFVHEFPDAGTYVFRDVAVEGSQMIVRVMPATASCANYPYQVLPTSLDSLTTLGINKTNVSNLSPNWALIASLMALFVASLIGLLITVIIWKPTAWGLLPADKIRPRYKAISGAPPDPIFLLPDKVQPSYDIRQEKGFFDDIIEEGGGIQTVSAALSTSAGNALMENLSVRTLYDKIDDQNMFLTAQLSRHQDDMEKFYETICQQNDQLKHLLEKTDFSKVHKIKSDERAGNDTENITLVKSSGMEDLPFVKRLFTTTGNPREDELINVLAGLLKKIENDGKEFVSGAGQSGGATSTNVVEHHFNAINDLERSILRDEEHKLKKTVDHIDQEMKQEIELENKELAAQLWEAGDNNSQVASLLNSHEDKIFKLREKFEDKKRAALTDLERELLEERKRKYREAIAAPDVPEEVKGFVVESMIDKSVLNFKENLAVSASNLSIISDQTLLDRLQEDMALSRQLTGEMESMIQDRVDSILDTFVDDETLTKEEKEEIKREAIDRQALLKQQMDSRKNHHRDIMKKKMQERKRKKIGSLPEKHARETAKLKSAMSLISSSFHSSQTTLTSSSYYSSQSSQLLNADLKEQVSSGQMTEIAAEELLKQLKEQQETEKEQVSGHLEAEELEELHKIEKFLDEEYKKSSSALCKETVMAALKTKGAITPGQEQETLEKFSKQMETLNIKLKQNETHQTADLENKIAERRRRQQLALRQDYENKRMQQLKEAQELLKPKTEQTNVNINIPVLGQNEISPEEEALARKHAETLTQLEQEQREELEALEEKLSAGNQGEEGKKVAEITTANAQEMRERRNKLQAELAARVDLTPDEAAKLQEAHEKELTKLKEKLEASKLRQEADLKEQLARRRQQKLLEAKKRQDLRKRQELEEQEKEKNQVRAEKVHNAENAAIKQGLQSNDPSMGGEVIKQVLAQRHQQEQQELIGRFDEEKRELVDKALSDLENRLKQERKQLTDKHAAELAALPEDDEEARADLLNRQQQELIEFDKKASAEKASFLQESMLDWETRRSDAMLDLRKKHLQELAKHAQDANVASAKEEAEANLRELENVRGQLEQDRENALKELDEQKRRFEEEQEQKMSAEIAQFETSLAAEREKEADRQKKMMENLTKRKEELLAEAEKRKQEKLKALKDQGASPEDTEALLNQHAEEVQRLANKLDADKLRQQQKLQEQLQKRRRKQKNQGIESIKETYRKNMDEKDNEIKQKLLEVHTKSASKIDTIVSSHSGGPSPSSSLPPGQLSVEDTLEMTVPLSETQLQDLLSSSPLVSKIQDIAELLANTQQGGYISKLNSQHDSDSELVPVDLNDLSPQDFVTYKFGCYVCQVADPVESPVTLLLASSIPPNTEYKQNAYRNLFYYDTHNQHLYLRSVLTRDVGSFTTVLVHCLAHVQVGEFGNDTRSQFVEALYSLMSKLNRELYNNRSDKLQDVDLHLLDVQDIFNIKLTGVDTFTEERLKSRVTSYRVLAAHSDLTSKLDETSANRGTSGKHYQEMLDPNPTTLLGKQMNSNNPHISAPTQRFSVKTYKHLALQELEEEEDMLNREFGVVCSDISTLQQTAENIGHEIISLTALLETAPETQVKELQETKEQTQTKLQGCRDKTAILKAKQSELLKKIGEVSAEIACKSEIMSIS